MRRRIAEHVSFRRPIDQPCLLFGFSVFPSRTGASRAGGGGSAGGPPSLVPGRRRANCAGRGAYRSIVSSSSSLSEMSCKPLPGLGRDPRIEKARLLSLQDGFVREIDSPRKFCRPFAPSPAGESRAVSYSFAVAMHVEKPMLCASFFRVLLPPPNPLLFPPSLKPFLFSARRKKRCQILTSASTRS